MRRIFLTLLSVTLLGLSHATADDIKKTDLYSRIKKSIDAVPAIDTHDHLRGFGDLPGQVETPRGKGMTL